MACRKGGLREEDKTRNAAAAAPSAVVSDALLFATMCIIGLPVDVHARDGSVYSGIFHTASVDNDYAIVLKNARMVRKGSQEANVVNGSLIETLIVPSEEFVQVVAKEVLLPANGITGSVGGKGKEAIPGHKEYLERESKVIKLNELRGNKKHKSQTRYSTKRENGFPYSSTFRTANVSGSSLEEHHERLDKIQSVKIDEAPTVSNDGRLVEDGSQEIKSDYRNNPVLQDDRIAYEIQGSSPSTVTVKILEKTHTQESTEGVSSGCSTALEDQNLTRPSSDGTACAVSSPPKVSVASIPIVDGISESRLNASSASFLPPVPPQSSNFKRPAKESTLNPGAKIFSPSMLHQRSVTPPAVPNGAGVPYMPDTYIMAPTATAHQEVDVSSFAHSPAPVKFIPYHNVNIGNGTSDASYVQPIIGQVVSRTQPVRYAGQYHNYQTGSGYVHPNSQNVMLGRMGPLVCMHPISSDIVQSAPAFSQATSRSLLTQHQVHLPKHQGNASTPALQLCMTPPIMANGTQQFVMPSSIPISQPLFPVLRPIAVPRSNGFFSTKFA